MAQSHFAEMQALVATRVQPVNNFPADLAATYQVFQTGAGKE